MQYKLEDRSATFDEQNRWGDDVIGIGDDASRRLHSIISAQERPLTICLNGEWGSGKTFFLTRFASDYSNRKPNGHAVYFNAWEEDFLNDPLLAIICQLKDVLHGDEAKTCYETIKNAVMPFLARTGLSIVGQAVKSCSGIDVSGVTVDDLRSRSECLFKHYGELETSRKELRAALERMSTMAWEETQEPLLFIVDELDRCRPTFAIELLERIKHLFCVPHMVFLIGVDVTQLEKSIKAVYGDIDAHDYLHRFFDLEVSLPAVDKMPFVYALWSEHALEPILRRRGVDVDSQRVTLDAFAHLIKFRRITLRQIEKCVRTYAFLALSSSYNSCRWALLAAVAVILKVTDVEAYERFMAMNYSLGELMNELYPDLSIAEVIKGGDVCSMLDHLTKIAYYGNIHTRSHNLLNLVKRALECQSDITFDAQIMPTSFKDATSGELAQFYRVVFADACAPSGRNEYHLIPQILHQMDCGLKFIGGR